MEWIRINQNGIIEHKFTSKVNEVDLEYWKSQNDLSVSEHQTILNRLMYILNNDPDLKVSLETVLNLKSIKDYIV